MTGRNRVLFIRVIKNKCPSPTLGWTAEHRVNCPLHGPRGSGGRETATLEDKACLWPLWRSHQPAHPYKTPILICTSQTSTQEYLDLTPSFGAQFLARGTPLSASSLHFVKPPLAPIAFVHPCPRSKAWLRGSRRPPTPSFNSVAFPERMRRTCGGIRRAHTQAHMHLCCQGVCEVCKLSVLGLQPRFDPRGFLFFTQAGILSGWIQDCSVFGFTDLSPDLSGIVTVTKGRLSLLFWLLANLPPVWWRRRCRHGRGWEESFDKPQHDWLEFQPAGASQKAWTGIYLQICWCISAWPWSYSGLWTPSFHQHKYKPCQVTVHSPFSPSVPRRGPNLGQYKDWALVIGLIKTE